MSSMDSSVFSRILFIEEYLKNVFNLESLYPLAVADMKNIVVDVTSSLEIYDGEQAPTYSPDGGWFFKNDAENAKIDWTFVDISSQGSEGVKTLEEYSGFYARVKLHSVTQLPFFNISTKHHVDAGTTGASRDFVFPTDHGFTPGTEVLMYYGADLPSTYPDIPHVELVLLDPESSNDADDNSQEFLSVSFSTCWCCSLDC